MNEDIKQLKTVIEAHDKLTSGMASIKDVKSIIDVLLKAIKDLKSTLAKEVQDGKKEALNTCKFMMDDISKIEKDMNKMMSDMHKEYGIEMSDMHEEHEKMMEKKASDMINKIDDIRKNIPNLDGIKDTIKSIKELIPDKKDIKKDVMSDVEKRLNDIYDTLKEYIDSRPKTEVSSRPIMIGGRSTLQIFDGISKVGTRINELSFGDNLAVTIVDGRITVSGTGGGSGYTKATPTGSVNSSNTSYTVTNEPVYVIADGITYFDGAGYTYSALTITMDNPPTQYIRYFF